MRVAWVGAIVVVMAGPVVAEPQRAPGAPEAAPGVELVYEGAHCAADDLQARVVALLERDPFVEDSERARRRETRLRVEVTEGARSGELGARLQAFEQGRSLGTRVFQASRCEALFDDMSLAIAMVIEAAGARGVAEGATVEPIVEPIVEPVSETVRSTRSRPIASSVVVGAGVAASWRGVAAATVGVRATRGTFSLAAEGELRAPEVEPVAQGRVRVTGGGVALVPCVHHRWLSGCGLVRAGWTRGRGEALVMAVARTSPEVALGGRVAAEVWPLTWLGLRAHAEARAHLTTTRYYVDEAAIWASDRVALWLGIAALAQIP